MRTGAATECLFQGCTQPTLTVASVLCEQARLGPFRHLAQTVHQYMDGILAYFDTKLTSRGVTHITAEIAFQRDEGKLTRMIE
jgi:hypothetical protein